MVTSTATSATQTAARCLPGLHTDLHKRNASLHSGLLSGLHGGGVYSGLMAATQVGIDISLELVTSTGISKSVWFASGGTSDLSLEAVTHCFKEEFDIEEPLR